MRRRIGCQSAEAASLAAESATLAAAERHMGRYEVPECGSCCDCRHFHECRTSDHVPDELARRLGFLGVCTLEADEPRIVDRAEVHDYEECWADAWA